MKQVPELLKNPACWSGDLAEDAAVERVLNSYIREIHIDETRLKANCSNVPINERLGSPFRVVLEQTKQVICGYLSYCSAIGHHSYSSHFFLEKENEYQPVKAKQVILSILDELSQKLEQNRQIERRDEIFNHVGNSIYKTQQYIQSFLEARIQRREIDFLASEQSLYFGHPFHPTPKSSEGFRDDDLQQYAPELQAKFVLNYWAIAPDLILEEWVSKHGDRKDTVIPQAVQSAAKATLDSHQQHYQLLPCHPWQAQYLAQLQVVQQLQKSGKLVNLGALGESVFPTSSVRTIWQPDCPYFYKLPLNVRITNFIRINPLEQLKRAMDAGKIISHLSQAVNRPDFQILMEFGFRTLSLDNLSHSDNAELIANFAVLFRESPTELQGNSNCLFVVASLLEPFPGSDEPKLFQAIRQTNQGKQPNLLAWLHQYLQVSLQPILHLFAETGISLEAHVQNSLVQLENGFPSKFYVRDLEGISLDKSLASAKGWLNSLIPETSPVLASEQETWLRLQYYFFVNHLGHLIHTLARYSKQNELVYWQVVRIFLQHEHTKTSSERLKKFTKALLENVTLPAKANLISRFQARSETPLYVNIANPIYLCNLKN